MATLQQQTTQLEFHQAMADFKTMFPDMDDEVIEVKKFNKIISIWFQIIIKMDLGCFKSKSRSCRCDNRSTFSYEYRQWKWKIKKWNGKKRNLAYYRFSKRYNIWKKNQISWNYYSNWVGLMIILRKWFFLDLEFLFFSTSTPDSELLPLKTIKGWSPPMLGPLPDDFLRISPTPWGGTHKKQVYLLYSYEKIKLNFII